MHETSRPRRATALLVASLVLVALNLRAALTVVGPLIGDLRADTGLSGTAAGLLAAAPLIAFGLMAPVAPVLAARFGVERALVGCMLVLAVSLALRPLPPVALLFAGTLAAGAGIAVANVLLPALVKQRFAARAAFMTGVYSVSLGVGASLAAGLAVPSESWLGSWRAALAVWSLLALVAALAWLPAARRASSPGRVRAGRGRVNLWHDRIAWQVTGFMAFQSVLFYSQVAWLPEIYRHEGMSKGAAGALLSLSLVVGIPFGFLAAAAAGRLRDQRSLALAAVLVTGIGWVGVLVAPNAAPSLWAGCLGAGLGAGFTLVLALFVLRAPDADHSAELSGMAQTLGYLVAAAGPVAIGALHDATGAWTLPLVVLVALTAAALVTAVGASAPGLVRGHGVAQPSAPEQPAPAASSAGR
ncbi:MAG: MFS transporter [Actinobacteria bacterium]|nr:MFS transporter [Actinomycetota bacterium]